MMDWTQAFAIIGSLGAFTFWLFTKLDADIKSSNSRIDQLCNRLDQHIVSSSERTDQLYQMFIDLLKDKQH